MKTFAVQILSVISLIPLVMGAPLGIRVAGDSGLVSRDSQRTPHRLQERQPSKLEDPVAREFSVITTEETRIPVGPGVDLVIDDYNIQTFDDNAILVLPTDPILQQVDNPLPQVDVPLPLGLGPVMPGPPMPMMMDC